MTYLRYILLISLTLMVTAVGAQSIYTEFGKNRIQYHDDFDDWWMYETDNFVTYWYGKGRNVAQSVIQLAELDYQSIQNVLEHRFNDKIQIIVYLDVADMKQSNIGLEDVFMSRNGRTRVMENKMFVYFNGDHQDLRQSIRQGIAEIYLESMLYGSNLQEVVQNAVLLHLPDWFKDGLIAYMGTEWNSDVDNELRDLFAPHGDVSDAQVIMDRDTGRSRGFGFVEMTNDAEAQTAIRELDGSDIGGRSLKVNVAKPRSR